MKQATRGILHIEQVSESNLVVESNLLPKAFIEAVAMAVAISLSQDEESMTVMKAGELFMTALANALKDMEFEELDHFPHVDKSLGVKN